jgi:acetyl-CoA carboxylase beta subunit
MEMQTAYTAQELFSHDKHGEKWAQCVRCYRWAHEDCGVEEEYFVCPMCRKSVKIVSYIIKYLLSHIRTPFLF